MRTTVTLDDELFARAVELTGEKKASSLLAESLKALIARETGRNLALLGGTDPDASAGPRRRGSAA